MKGRYLIKIIQHYVSNNKLDVRYAGFFLLITVHFSNHPFRDVLATALVGLS
jgi:hypothetical protein